MIHLPRFPQAISLPSNGNRDLQLGIMEQTAILSKAGDVTK